MGHTEYLFDKVHHTIAKHNLASSETPVLLMVSGGSDSTALAYIARKLLEENTIGHLAMLHVNHQLRGESSDGDQVFVQQLADMLDVPLFICEIDVAAEAHRLGDNVEAVARRERYLAANEALKSLCMHHAVPLVEGRIFTAHTQDDRVENFYMRSIVGTGPGGFRSMKYTNGPVARPLMDLSREDLRDFIQECKKDGNKVALDEAGCLWREDATNAHTDRFRAYVRHEIVPKAKERNPQLLNTLCRSMNLIADEDEMLEAQAAQLVESVVVWVEMRDDGFFEKSGGCVFEPSLGLEPLPLQRRVCAQVLQTILGADARVETASVEAVLCMWENGVPVSGKTDNIQGDLAVSSNKRGVRIEPMAAYRTRRKKKGNA